MQIWVIWKTWTLIVKHFFEVRINFNQACFNASFDIANTYQWYQKSYLGMYLTTSTWVVKNCLEKTPKGCYMLLIIKNELVCLAMSRPAKWNTSMMHVKLRFGNLCYLFSFLMVSEFFFILNRGHSQTALTSNKGEGYVTIT